MFKSRNYNASQKRLAKFALIKYRINFWNYGVHIRWFTTAHLTKVLNYIPTSLSHDKFLILVAFLNLALAAK